MILIAGASGMVGTEVCRLLRGRGLPVRALVRRTTEPAKVQLLQSMGAELVVGDVRDHRSLERACEGAKAVVSALSSFQPQQPGDMQTVLQAGQINLIDAAKASGVEHFIPSTYGLNPDRVEAEAPLVDAKAAAEQYLIQSGVAYTILYTGFFMEAWLSPTLGFDGVNAKARLYGSGRNPLSWISMRDVAQAIVACLENPRFQNRVLDLGGPEVLAPLQVVEIFEEEGGRRFEAEFVPEDALKGMEAAAQDPVQKTIAVFLQVYARGYVIDRGDLESEIPLRFTSIREYARSLVGQATDPGAAVVAPTS